MNMLEQFTIVVMTRTSPWRLARVALVVLLCMLGGPAFDCCHAEHVEESSCGEHPEDGGHHQHVIVGAQPFALDASKRAVNQRDMVRSMGVRWVDVGPAPVVRSPYSRVAAGRLGHASSQALFILHAALLI